MNSQSPKSRPVALITGASSGIGYAAALAFARSGYDVTVTARRADRLEALAAAIEALPEPHGAALALAADVTDADQVQAAVARTIERFGRLDVLVANAGIGQRGGLVDSPWADIELLMRTNIDGVLFSIRAAVPEMRRQGRGHIIIVSSVTATMTAPYVAAYAASKAFISSIARSLRLELEADHIRVTEMLIGRTATEFNQKRLGAAGYAGKATLPVMSPEKVADAMVSAVRTGRKLAILRPLDRLVIWANALIPNVIGRRAAQQYRV